MATPAPRVNLNSAICVEIKMTLHWDQINKNASIIVANIAPESVDVYLFLSEQFKKGNICENFLFQFVFRSFYRIDNAGLTPEFKNRYFELMEEAKNSDCIDLSCLAKDLYEYPNIKGNNSLQFSFISKLANTVDDSYPIFDSEIGRLYGFRTPYNYKDFEVRLNEYLSFYEVLISDYKQVLSENLLDIAFKEFESVFPPTNKPIPDIKRLDFLLWSAGKLKNRIKM